MRAPHGIILNLQLFELNFFCLLRNVMYVTVQMMILCMQVMKMYKVKGELHNDFATLQLRCYEK